MLDRIAHTLRLPLVGMTCLVGLWLAMPASTAAPAPLQSAQFDPSDVYFQGYLAVRAAEQLEASGNFIGAMEKAAAFVTDEGGITCHAAIIAREMKKPCIIGTKNATKVLKDGDIVEVDANTGIVKIISFTMKMLKLGLLFFNFGLSFS